MQLGAKRGVIIGEMRVYEGSREVMWSIVACVSSIADAAEASR